MSDKIICSRSLTCAHRKKEAASGFECGGALPHTGNGCEKCSVDPGATCVPLCAHYYELALVRRDEAGRHGVESGCVKILEKRMRYLWSLMDEGDRRAARILVESIDDLQEIDRRKLREEEKKRR